MNDFYEVGFSINHQMLFKLQLQHFMIGAYGITFNKNSHYIYKVTNNCEGFFVRRSKWLELMDTISADKSDGFSTCFKRYLKDQYENKINKVLHRCKVKETTKISSRFNSGIISLNVKQKKDNLTPSEIRQKTLKKSQLDQLNTTINLYNAKNLEERLLSDGANFSGAQSPAVGSINKQQLSILNSAGDSSENEEEEDD